MDGFGFVIVNDVDESQENTFYNNLAGINKDNLSIELICYNFAVYLGSGLTAVAFIYLLL